MRNRPDLYPTMRLGEAVERAQEVRSSPPLAAVIDADYGAPSEDHGPEGLMVVRGERLDGADRCDDDYNAALRPWLGLGDGRDAATGLISATITRLETDSSPVSDWIYTAIGGGPWLVRDGAVVSDGTGCTKAQDKKLLYQWEPLRNCIREKEKKEAPLQEYYAGSCRPAPHTAAGLSRDGRWLFLVITTSNEDPDTIAQYLSNKLGAWQALKFDGGGSTQLWYKALPEPVDPTGQERPLSNFLAVYAKPGDGIRLPLAAKPVEPVYYQVVTAGETAEITLEVRNSGLLTWHPDDQVGLRHEPWFFLSPSPESLTLSRSVAPGGIGKWKWEVQTQAKGPTVRIQRFRMYQRGEPFGSEMAVVVIGLPPEWEDRREEIEREINRLIEELKARGEEEVDRLVEEINKWLETKFKEWRDTLIEEFLRYLEETCNSACGSAGLVLLTLAIVRAWRHRPPAG